MNKQVVYIISQVDKAVAFEWIVEEFENKEIDISFIVIHNNFDTPLIKFLKEKGIKLYLLPLKSKWNFPFLWFKVFKILAKVNPLAVHTHLFEGSLIGLSAAKMAGVRKRVFTRHHSTYHHEYFPKAIKYDHWINAMATHIIAISNNVKEVLVEIENVAANRVFLVEHGFRLEQFKCVDQSVSEALRTKYNLPTSTKVIGVISRYIEWKGVNFIIEAFKEIHEKDKNTHLLLANASGPYIAKIKEELGKLPNHSYTEIPFEDNLFALYSLIDIYVHCPIDKRIEAFGQTYVEALASSTPSVFTLSGIAKDFIIDERNALVVDPQNSIQIKEAIERLLEDYALNKSLVSNGLKDVERFELKNMTDKLEKIYLS